MYIRKEIRFYNHNFPVANPIENKHHSQSIQIPWNRDQYSNNAPLLFYFFLHKNVPVHQPHFTVVVDRFIF